MKFFIYDIIFLVVFTLAVILFLYTRRSNLQRQGILYLYKTKVGLKVIEYTATKFKKILQPLQYLIVVCGYTLMAFISWFLLKFSYLYITSPFMAEELKIPVLMPLIPYLPEIFDIKFLPPFPFTYWIIIIAIIAIPHEFAHGIFSRLNKIPVHSTGFGFLGPFLAAFVEPDEKMMNKSKKFPQLSILGAGTFANVLTTILFAMLLLGFFTAAFTPAGVVFNSYGITTVNLTNVNSITNITSEGYELDEEEIPNLKLVTDDGTYYTSDYIMKKSLQKSADQIIVYENAPAFQSKLYSAITSINGQQILSHQNLTVELSKYSPGDTIEITTVQDDLSKTEQVTLSEREGKAYLGVRIQPPLERSGIMGLLFIFLGEVKEPSTHYTSPLGDFGWFIYHLLWWTVIISFSVALVNMIPVGIFDGGRFFYLTVLGLTGSEKFAKKAFAFSTWFVLLVVTLLMVRWVFVLF